MAESVDVKAGVKHILERIQGATKNRPEKVKLINTFTLKFSYQFFIFSLRIRFNWWL